MEKSLSDLLLYSEQSLIFDFVTLRNSLIGLLQADEKWQHSHFWSKSYMTSLMLRVRIFYALFVSAFLKVTKTELEKLKSSYRQLIKEVNSAKEKYKEAVAKGMTDFSLCVYYCLFSNVL